jgi:hypothetical protein
MKENVGVLLPVSSLPSRHGIGDFGKNIEYVKLLEDEFKNEGGIFENISSNNLANITKIDNIVLDTSATSEIEKEGYSHLTIDLTNKESDVSL